MAVIGVILVIIFVLTCIFLVSLVLLQNSEGEGLGGLFAGSSNSAFGSRSATVLTKVTYVSVSLFFVVAFFLALVNKTPSDRGFQQEVQSQRSSETRESWWTDSNTGDAVIEEADQDSQDFETAMPEEAEAVLQDFEIELQEEEGEALQGFELVPPQDADAALRPD